jgi:hypothetical protein
MVFTASAATADWAGVRPASSSRTRRPGRDTGDGDVDACVHRDVDSSPQLLDQMKRITRRITRIAVGFARFRNYSIRVLLSAGRPHQALLARPSRPVEIRRALIAASPRIPSFLRSATAPRSLIDPPCGTAGGPQLKVGAERELDGEGVHRVPGASWGTRLRRRSRGKRRSPGVLLNANRIGIDTAP